MDSINPSESPMRKAIICRVAFEQDTTWVKIGTDSKGATKILGKPVYATANGIVVLARDMRMGWGNLVIIRHIFLEDRQMKTADSVYAHLDKIFVREGKQIVRGQQIGTIGTNRGMYTGPSPLRNPQESLHRLQPARFRQGFLQLLRPHAHS